MSGIILSVDIGTSSLKAAFIDFSGKLIAFSRIPYGTSLPNNNLLGDINFPKAAGSGEWEKAFALSLEDLKTQSGGSAIEGISISGNGPTLVPVTAGGESLPNLDWFDEKVIKFESKQMQESGAFIEADAFGEVSSLKKSGADEVKSFFLPRAAWLKKNEPELYKKTSVFLSSHEWLAFRLGTEALTVLPNEAYEPYYWDETQCLFFSLDKEKFPPFIKMGTFMGQVSENAAARYGHKIKSGTPVISGGPDFITALLGTGTWNKGDVCDRAGSSEGINVCAAELKNDLKKIKDFRIRVLPHFREGFWNIGALIPFSGRLFERYLAESGNCQKPYEELFEKLIPSLSPEIFRSPESGGRSVLCEIGFKVRSAINKLGELGFPVNEMKVSGGQGKNPRWNQLKADITGVKLVVPEIRDGELAGNAALAVAALEKKSIEETALSMIRIGDVYKPSNAEFWEMMYNKYFDKRQNIF